MENESYHLIGIGGIGMSSLAKLLLEKEEKVTGSDQRDNQLIQELIEKGAQISLTHKKENLKNPKAVVFSSAIKDNNEEIIAAKEKNIPIMHRSKLLASLMDGKVSLLVAGTHGKTTTSSLLATVLQETKNNISFAIGGVVNNYQTNAKLGTGDLFVAEADESDGSFLNLFPTGAIVTSIEADHLDYWKNEEKYFEGFLQFFQKVEDENLLFWCKDDPGLASLSPPGVSYGFSKESELQILSYSVEEFVSYMHLSFEGKVYKDIEFPLVGRHQAQNCAAVFGLALRLGLDESQVRKGLAAFLGVQRRMSLIGEAQGVKCFEDYAHHPSEIYQTIKAFRNSVEERRIVACFQPHRYSRTRDFLDEFVKSFDEVDHLFVFDVYSAGEDPKDGINSQELIAKIQERQKTSCTYVSRDSYQEVVDFIAPHDRVIMLGAGDINEIGRDLFQDFRLKKKKLKIGLLYGGESPEHDISKASAKFIENNIDRSLYDLSCFHLSKKGEWLSENTVNEKGSFEEFFPQEVFANLLEQDLCIPIFHGPRGEDGMVNAFLETLKIPYTGCGYASAALSMNKAQLKKIVSYHGIPTSPFISFTFAQWKRDADKYLLDVEESDLLPLFVKPVHQGSSIGISFVEKLEELKEAIDYAFDYDEEVMLEKKVIGREIEFGVMGNDFIHVSHPGEILTRGNFYSYEAKYGKSSMQTTAKAALSNEALVKGKELAKQVYQSAGCKGMARIDFFLDDMGSYCLNEINPIPGLTTISLFAKVMENYRWKPTELIDRLIFLGLQAKRVRDKV